MIYHGLGAESPPSWMDEMRIAHIPETGPGFDQPLPGATSRIVMDPALILGDTEAAVAADVAASRKKRWGWIAAIAAVAAGAYFTMKG